MPSLYERLMDPKWKGVILEVIHTLDSETLVFLQDMISGELDIRGLMAERRNNMPSLYERLMAEVCDKEKEVVKGWLLDAPDDYLIYFKNLIETELSEREAEELANAKDYTFGFYVDDQLVDYLHLDTGDESLAIDAFLNEQGWNSKLTIQQRETAYVDIIEKGGD